MSGFIIVSSGRHVTVATRKTWEHFAHGADIGIRGDEKVYEQVTNVATLPGIERTSYAMPDAHWGYGFPIGGVAAFDPDRHGVVSAGGVGFDISCGRRLHSTGLTRQSVEPLKKWLAASSAQEVARPAGHRRTGGPWHPHSKPITAGGCGEGSRRVQRRRGCR